MGEHVEFATLEFQVRMRRIQLGSAEHFSIHRTYQKEVVRLVGESVTGDDCVVILENEDVVGYQIGRSPHNHVRHRVQARQV